MGGIYQIANTKTGKRYVGRARIFRARWNAHRHKLRNNKHANSHLQRAWNKYGEESFLFLPMIICDQAYSILVEEKLLNEGIGEYNQSKMSCGGPGHGGPLTLEHRAKISASLKGRKKSIEARAKMSAVKKGMVPIACNTQDVIRKRAISLSKSGKARGEKISAALKGRYSPHLYTAEARAKAWKTRRAAE